MTAINPSDLSAVAKLAQELNEAIYPDGNAPEYEDVYVKVTAIEVWSGVQDRVIGVLREHEDGMFLEFVPGAPEPKINLHPPGVR